MRVLIVTNFVPDAAAPQRGRWVRDQIDELERCGVEVVRFEFPPGSAWVCFSDQTVHAAMSGQYMMEQTFHLPASKQYNPDASPLAILGRLAGHPSQPLFRRCYSLFLGNRIAGNQ